MTGCFQPLGFKCGAVMKNRLALAPLTNTQSHRDGSLSDVEYNWLTMRARGGFGLTMTCASHVQPVGKGFAGQLGCFSDDHLPADTSILIDDRPLNHRILPDPHVRIIRLSVIITAIG